MNLKTLTEQLSEISQSFITFGRVAGVSPTALIEIAARCSNYTDSMTAVCDLWLQKYHQEQTPPTWQAVSKILHLIGHNELSRGLLEVYKTGMNIQILLETKCSGIQVTYLNFKTLSKGTNICNM